MSSYKDNFCEMDVKQKNLEFAGDKRIPSKNVRFKQLKLIELVCFPKLWLSFLALYRSFFYNFWTSFQKYIKAKPSHKHF